MAMGRHSAALSVTFVLLLVNTGFANALRMKEPNRPRATHPITVVLAQDSLLAAEQANTLPSPPTTDKAGKMEAIAFDAVNQTKDAVSFSTSTGIPQALVMLDRLSEFADYSLNVTVNSAVDLSQRYQNSTDPQEKAQLAQQFQNLIAAQKQYWVKINDTFNNQNSLIPMLNMLYTCGASWLKVNDCLLVASQASLEKMIVDVKANLTNCTGGDCIILQAELHQFMVDLSVRMVCENMDNVTARLVSDCETGSQVMNQLLTAAQVVFTEVNAVERDAEKLPFGTHAILWAANAARVDIERLMSDLSIVAANTQSL